MNTIRIIALLLLVTLSASAQWVSGAFISPSTKLTNFSPTAVQAGSMTATQTNAATFNTTQITPVFGGTIFTNLTMSSAYFCTTAASIPNNAFTPIPYDTTAWADLPMRQTGNTNFKASIAGVYRFTANVVFPAKAGGASRNLSFAYNGSTLRYGYKSGSINGGTGGVSLCSTAIIKMAVNDTVSVQVLQDSGSTSTITPDNGGGAGTENGNCIVFMELIQITH